MIHLQIRAKSGLHAGAVWKLDNSLITLGASSNSDVFLCDPEIPDSLISLRRQGRRFQIESIHPSARLTSSENKKVDQTIFPSQILSLDFKHIQLELQVVNAVGGLFASFGDGYSRMLHRMVQLLRGIGARAIIALLFIVGLILTSMILFFGTAGVAKSQASMIKKAQMTKKPVPTMGSRMAVNIAEEINEFARKASLETITVKVDHEAVNVDVQLSRAQAVFFEKEMMRYARDYGDFVDLNVKLAFTEEQLVVDAIQIEQIVLGSQPLVVLRDGARLYVGADYEGINLVSIDSRKVVFKGQAIYEVSL